MFFDFEDYFDSIQLNLKNTVLPRAYALIKIHKQSNPVRIIVSSINSPLYSFDKCLSFLFNKYFLKPISSFKNSYEIKSCLMNNIIPENYKLLSLDVVSMFPNLPYDLILQALDRKWKFLRGKIPLTKKEFLSGVSFLLHSTYIQFNGKF